MTPLTEWTELKVRANKMLDSILLLILAALHLLVAAVTLFCAVWISVFTTGRAIIDRQAARIAAPKEVM